MVRRRSKLSGALRMLISQLKHELEELANDALTELFDIEIPDADTGSIEGEIV